MCVCVIVCCGKLGSCMTQSKRVLKRSSDDETGHIGAVSSVNPSMKHNLVH